MPDPAGRPIRSSRRGGGGATIADFLKVCSSTDLGRAELKRVVGGGTNDTDSVARLCYIVSTVGSLWRRPRGGGGRGRGERGEGGG